MYKISVIVPIYNAEQTINKCLDSIFSQTYKNIEVIALNDGSKDNSLDILNDWKRKHRNLIIIDKNNEGVAITRNKGIKEASGDYLVFIDNDDFIDNDYIETLVSEIDSEIDIVISGYRRININNRILHQEKLNDTEWSKYIIMAPWAKIYRKKFLLDNNIQFLNYGIGEDVYFNLTAYSFKPKIKIIKYVGYNWFFNTKSVSNTSQRGFSKDIDIIYLLDKVAQYYNNHDQFISYFYIRYCIWYLLFTGRDSSSYQFNKEYNKIKQWQKKNNIRLKIFPLSKKLKGEDFRKRLIVLIFIIIEKLNLVNFFSKIYCRGVK